MVQLFINSSVLVADIWLISMALITRTNSTQATLVFKVIPMLIGLACLFSAIKLFGWM